MAKLKELVKALEKADRLSGEALKAKAELQVAIAKNGVAQKAAADAWEEAGQFIWAQVGQSEGAAGTKIAKSLGL